MGRTYGTQHDPQVAHVCLRLCPQSSRSSCKPTRGQQQKHHRPRRSPQLATTEFSARCEVGSGSHKQYCGLVRLRIMRCVATGVCYSSRSFLHELAFSFSFRAALSPNSSAPARQFVTGGPLLSYYRERLLLEACSYHFPINGDNVRRQGSPSYRKEVARLRVSSIGWALSICRGIRPGNNSAQVRPPSPCRHSLSSELDAELMVSSQWMRPASKRLTLAGIRRCIHVGCCVLHRQICGSRVVNSGRGALSVVRV